MSKTTTRHAKLRDILFGRQRDLQEDVRRRIRDGRTDRPHDGDALERSDTDISEDVQLALLQMNAETLRHVNEAIGRLELGEYGNCSQCGAEILEARLRALPFAIRCTACEEKREETQAHTRQSREPAGLWIFSEGTRS